MFADLLLDMPLEALRALCASQATRISNLQSIVDNGFTGFKGSGVTVAGLREKGFTCLDLEEEFGLYDLKDAFPLEELLQHFTVKDLQSQGFNAKELVHAGYTAAALSYESYPSPNLIEKGREYYAKKLITSGVNNVNEFKNAGFKFQTLKAAGFSLADLKYAGFTLKEMKDAGVTIQDLICAGFTVKELRYAGCTAEQLKNYGQLAAHQIQQDEHARRISQATPAR